MCPVAVRPQNYDKLMIHTSIAAEERGAISPAFDANPTADQNGRTQGMQWLPITEEEINVYLEKPEAAGVAWTAPVEQRAGMPKRGARSKRVRRSASFTRNMNDSEMVATFVMGGLKMLDPITDPRRSIWLSWRGFPSKGDSPEDLYGQPLVTISDLNRLGTACCTQAEAGGGGFGVGADSPCFVTGQI